MNKDNLMKNNKGFTIVEVILSIVLASSLMICISTIMLSQTTIMSEINQVESAKIIGDNMINYIKDRLINAKTLVVYDPIKTVSTNGVDERILYVYNGAVYDNSLKVNGELGKDYNVQYGISLSNVMDGVKNTPIITLRVDVLDRSMSRIMYTTSTSFTLYAYSARGKTFKIDNYDNSHNLGEMVLNPHIIYTVVNENNIY
jgi:type II secretory pathway pseudopilin PulG